jgi:hypothetical protein
MLKKLMLVLFLIIFISSFAYAGDADVDQSELKLNVELSDLIVKSNEELIVDIELLNNSQEDLVLNFSSGQSYEIYIKNWQKEVIYTWSADKMFTQAFKEITIEAGEGQSFQEKIAAHQFRAGVYFLEVEIKSLEKEIANRERIFFVVPTQEIRSLLKIFE